MHFSLVSLSLAFIIELIACIIREDIDSLGQLTRELSKIEEFSGH